MVPARQVGGDFYDFFPLNKRFFCFSIGEGELFGNERFFKIMNQDRELKARHLIEKIQINVESFVGVTPASDDLTMLALTLTGLRT
jgi:serine phosphatase RsbU (regulator of sigma subunit)